MKSISDTLILAGYCVDEKDLVMNILAGLPAEYDAAITSILSQNSNENLTIQ